MFRSALQAFAPRHVGTLVREMSRHLLRRPVVGVCAVARTDDGRLLLIRRGDTGGWALPGGTLEWGETLAAALPRELAEEAGADVLALGRVTGVYSRPDRDWRFHAVTICVEARVGPTLRGPKNPLEVREARLFTPGDLPPLGMGMQDMLAHALEGSEARLE